MDFLSEKNFVAAAMLIFALVFLAFFPGIYASIDEHTFLKNALLLRSGSLAEPDPELACRSNTINQNGYFGTQFIGKSFFLIPFTFLGLSGVMLSGLIIHIINTAIICLILSQLKIDARFSILYIFFPAFLWEARTLYSELLVLTCFLAAFYFYTRNTTHDNIVSGAMFCLAALVRYDAAAGFVAFCLPLVLSDRKKLSELLLGFIPIAILIGAFNSLAYSGPLNTGYGSGASIAASLINLDIFPLVIFAAMLLIIYPLMLAAPFLNRDKYRLQFALLALAYLFFAARFADITAFDISIETLLTARIRVLIPMIGLLLIPYSAFLDSRTKKFGLDKTLIFSALLIVFTIGSVFASSQHESFLDSRYATYTQILENVPEGALLIGSSDDCMFSMTPELKSIRYLNIVPKIDLGAGSPDIDLANHLGGDTYILSLAYSSRIGRTAERETVIEREREKMDDFILANRGSIETVFETEKPNKLVIYRWLGQKPGP